jgi:hypothetical protein
MLAQQKGKAMDDIMSLVSQYPPPPGSVQPLGQALIFQPMIGQQTGMLYVGGSRGIFRGELWSPPAETDPFMAGMMLTVHRIVLESQLRQQRWTSNVMVMRESIRTLTNEVTMLKCEIQRLHQLRTYVVPLATLKPEPFQMIQQIPVTVEGDGEDFTATFVEANVSASGETEADAIANFKDSLLSSYEILEAIPPGQLGPLPSRQWEVLHDVIKRTD